MKVLLTLPPLTSPIKANFMDNFDNESGQYPPIGLLYIAAYLLQHSHHTVKVLDPQAENLSQEKTLKIISDFKPDVVGIHVLTFHLIDCIELASHIRSSFPETKIICGGPHVHIYPQETLKQPGVDYTMVGEGESSFKKLLDYLEGDCARDEVPGLYYYDNTGKIRLTKPNEVIRDLNLLPHPARQLINTDLYSSVLAKHAVATTIMTSRGCPYKCIYCDRPALGKNFRARSPENVIEELKLCLEMGINEFNIFDDTFTIDRQRVIEICKLLIEQQLPIRWSCRSRVHLVNPEMLSWMKKAGCGRISFGVETGNEKIGKILKKGANVDTARKAIQMTKKAGIEVLADFILGNPDETKKEIEETIQFALKEKPDYAQFSIMTPYPATELYTLGLNTKLYKNDHWRDFAANPDPDWQTPIWDEHFSKEELIQIVKDAYRRFYFRPRYMLRQMARLKSLGEFKRKIRAGFRVLTTCVFNSRKNNSSLAQIN